MSKDQTNKNTKEAAIKQYRGSHRTVTDIAKRHNISVSQLSAWVGEGGIPRRPRGPRRLKNPSIRSRGILQYAISHGFSKAANRFCVSRQHISSLARRWGIAARKRVTKTVFHDGGLVFEKRRRRPRREVVISFRLRADELIALRASLPQSITQTATSSHRLVRAAVLAHLDQIRMSLTSPTLSSRFNSSGIGS